VNEFFGIVGLNPSKGARSPKLWNRVYKKFKTSMKMKCIDIPKNNFNPVVKELLRDKNFLGGAITNPYKENFFKIIKKSRIENKALKAKSLNIIYRYKNNFYGANTDGEAATQFLKTKCRNLKKKKILILGFGGAGKAIASYLNYQVQQKIIIATRKIHLKKIIKKLGYEYVNFNKIINIISKIDIIINCTSVGHRSKKTPINKHIINICKKKIFFDIIYQPKKTTLLRLAEKNNVIYNGREMNLLQAAIAFCKANKYKNLKRVKQIMRGN
jgi:shikimate dehydrogenase